MTWAKTADGSIIDQSGKVIYFSSKRFIDDICLGNCCFICGADPAQSHSTMSTCFRNGCYGGTTSFPERSHYPPVKQFDTTDIRFRAAKSAIP